MGLLNRWASYLTVYGIGSGLLVALEVLVVTSVTTLIWGLIIALLRMSPFKPLQFLATAYIEIFRGTPLLVQLLVLFAVLPVLIGFFLSPFLTAVLALTLNTGSYMAENYRSGLQAVPKGQIEAATALGMSSFTTFRRVIFPLAIRVILPSFGNIVLGILITTSFVYLVGLQDMMAKASLILSVFGDMSGYVVVTIIYVLLGVILISCNSMLERKLRLPE